MTWTPRGSSADAVVPRCGMPSRQPASLRAGTRAHVWHHCGAGVGSYPAVPHPTPLSAGIVVGAVCSAAVLALAGVRWWRRRRHTPNAGADSVDLHVQKSERSTHGLETPPDGSSFGSRLGAGSCQQLKSEQQGVQVGLSGASCTCVLQLAATPYTCWQDARSQCCLALPHPHPQPPTAPLAQNAGRPDPRHRDPRVGSTFQ